MPPQHPIEILGLASRIAEDDHRVFHIRLQNLLEGLELLRIVGLHV
jgi:hypothetical protein